MPPEPVPNATMYVPAVTPEPVITIPTLNVPELISVTFSVVVLIVPVNNAWLTEVIYTLLVAVSAPPVNTMPTANVPVTLPVGVNTVPATGLAAPLPIIPVVVLAVDVEVALNDVV